MNYEQLKAQLSILEENKPVGTLVGVDSNVFNVISYVTKKLKESKMYNEANAFSSLAMQADSYADVIMFADSVLKQEESDENNEDCDCHVDQCKCL